MAKQKPLTGDKLLLVEELRHVHAEYLDISTEVRNQRNHLNALRAKRKQIMDHRDNLIREAVKQGVPKMQVGRQLGLAKSTISYIEEKY